MFELGDLRHTTELLSRYHPDKNKEEQVNKGAKFKGSDSESKEKVGQTAPAKGSKPKTTKSKK